jgi:hypothetical protein
LIISRRVKRRRHWSQVKKRREKKVAVTSKEGRSDDDVKQMPFIV